jgi:hypothetical protein
LTNHVSFFTLQADTISKQEKINMTQVSPWHSKKEPHYHNNNKCGPGKEIPASNRVAGTGGKKLCKDCDKLNKEGK